MNILVGERGQGKTTHLIQMSAAGKGAIVTFSKQTAKDIKFQAKELNLKIPDPIAWNEFINSPLKLKGPYLLDELGAMLRRYEIETATIDTKCTIEPLSSVVEHYGDRLTEELRNNTKDLNSVSDFEKFVLDNGFRYETKTELQAAYDRHWKAAHDILVSLDEFIIESGNKFPPSASDRLVLVYKALVGLVEAKKLLPGDVLAYAYYHWCLNEPEAIIAYQTGRDKWTVNNCGAEITEEAARIKICDEWGFETGRVHIIGTPYYDATDYQFIRFNCGHMAWLWANGDLLQVYC